MTAVQPAPDHRAPLRKQDRRLRAGAGRGSLRGALAGALGARERRSQLREALGTPGSLGLVAVDGAGGVTGFLLGACETTARGATFCVQWVCVRPGVKGTGVGRDLLFELEAVLTARDGGLENFYERCVGWSVGTSDEALPSGAQEPDVSVETEPTRTAEAWVCRGERTARVGTCRRRPRAGSAGTDDRGRTGRAPLVSRGSPVYSHPPILHTTGGPSATSAPDPVGRPSSGEACGRVCLECVWASVGRAVAP